MEEGCQSEEADSDSEEEGDQDWLGLPEAGQVEQENLGLEPDDHSELLAWLASFDDIPDDNDEQAAAEASRGRVLDEDEDQATASLAPRATAPEDEERAHLAAGQGGDDVEARPC